MNMTHQVQMARTNFVVILHALTVFMSNYNFYTKKYNIIFPDEI